MTVVPRLIVFSLTLGGLRDPRLFALAGVAAWAAVWLQRPPLGPAAPWLPWLGWAALSTLLCAQPLAGLPALARWSAVLAVASLAASWNAREREDWLKSFLVVAAALAVAALADGASIGFGGGGMSGLIPPYYNYTAFALAAAAAAAAAWIAHPRGPRGLEAKAAAALALIALVSLGLSRSRGAWLGLAAAAAVWSIRRWGARAAAALAVAAAVFAGALAAGLLPGVAEDAIFKRYRMHAEARPRIWRAATQIASDRPWLGTGPGNFAVGFRLRPVPFEDGAARWSMTTDYAHSEPLQAAAETGWAGLALWLLAAGAALRALWARAGSDPIREAAAAAAAAMTAQLAVDNMLQIPALAALWLCALALSRPPAGGRPWPRAAVLAGALLAAAAWIPKTLAAVSPARAAAIFPADPSPREDLAYAAAAAGRPAEADAHWLAAEALAPFNAIHPWRRGQLAGAFGRWRDAERLAARAVKLEPGFVGARLLRAESLARLGQAQAAHGELDALRLVLQSRGAPAFHSGYEESVWRFDEAEFRRIARLLPAGAVK